MNNDDKLYSQKDMDDLRQQCVKTVEAGMVLFTHNSFSEGYLSPTLKYKVTMTHVPTSQHLAVLIKKLQQDMKHLQKTEQALEKLLTQTKE